MKTCKFCASSSKKDLCNDCLLDFKDGFLDKCHCGSYKNRAFEICFSCHKNNELPEIGK